MTSFVPPRANPPVLRFFSLRSPLARGFSRNFRELYANFTRTLRETGGINCETFFNLAVELYKVTSNKISNSSLLPRDLKI